MGAIKRIKSMGGICREEVTGHGRYDRELIGGFSYFFEKVPN